MILALFAAFALNGSVLPPAAATSPTIAATATRTAPQALDPAIDQGPSRRLSMTMWTANWRVIPRGFAALCTRTLPNAPCAQSLIRTKPWACGA